MLNKILGLFGYKLLKKDRCNILVPGMCLRALVIGDITNLVLFGLNFELNKPVTDMKVSVNIDTGETIHRKITILFNDNTGAVVTITDHHVKFRYFKTDTKEPLKLSGSFIMTKKGVYVYRQYYAESEYPVDYKNITPVKIKTI